MKRILQGSLPRWAAGVLLLCAGLVQIGAAGAGGRLTDTALAGQLEASGLYTQRAQWLQGQLDTLAQAAGLEDAGTAADPDSLAQAGAAQLAGQPLPDPQAGAKLRQAVSEDQPAEALEDEKVAQLLNLLEQQANEAETQAMELPAAEQLAQLAENARQNIQTLPLRFGIGAVLALVGLALLCLPGFGAKERLFGLALACLGAAGALGVFCRWPAADLSGLEQPWQALAAGALEGWYGAARRAAVLYAAVMAALGAMAAAAGIFRGRRGKKGKEES